MSSPTQNPPLPPGQPPGDTNGSPTTQAPIQAPGPANASALPARSANDSSRATQLSSLSVSLLQDLMRAELGGGGQRALLEVLAAAVRHGQAVSTRLQLADERQLVLTLLPRQRLMHCSLDLNALLATELARWQVMEVLPAVVPAPASSFGQALQPIKPPFAAMAPLLWAVALAGARSALLPELAGQAAYRVAPGANLSGLYMPGPMLDCVTRLRRETCSLPVVAGWPEVGLERAQRLLNALYLQSALITSRAHPAATNEGWAGYDGQSASA